MIRAAFVGLVVAGGVLALMGFWAGALFGLAGVIGLWGEAA